MKDRCSNSKNIHYSYYGGRGITVKTHSKSFIHGQILMVMQMTYL